MRRSGIKSFSLAMMAVAIAAIGLLALLIVDHGPGNKPQAAAGAQPNTEAAAQAVGATVTPTSPQSPLEPAVPGPKPAQPAIPASK
jgi:Flp pilus assembly protein CpaB